MPLRILRLLVSMTRSSPRLMVHYLSAFMILLSHFANSLITPTSSRIPSRFILSACIRKQPVTTFPKSFSNFRSISSGMRRSSSTSTSVQATPTGGGAYQEVPQKELLEGVLNRPVQIQRPETLRNKYFGLRHGNDGNYIL